MPQAETKHARTLDDLRRTICMVRPGEELTLHENKLTEIYGLSRTPIRQILQRLSYERLVETRSGVGTAAVALRQENRARDLLVHHGIMQAILLLDIPELSIAQHSDILALAGIASMMDESDRDVHYDVRKRLHNVLSDLIPDPILLDAFSASYWRIVRWHMWEMARNAEETSKSFRNLIVHISEYEPRNGLDLFRRLIEAERFQA